MKGFSWQKEQKVNDNLNAVEAEIRRLVQSCYNGLRIMVSIQILQAGQEPTRPKPCNDKCGTVILNDAFRKLCDNSDKGMKVLLSEWIQKSSTEMTIAYRCHGNMSNLVTATWDDHFRTFWYIFLGQFILEPWPGYERLFQDESIKILGDATLQVAEEYKGSVKDGVFWKGDWADVQGVQSVTVPQLIGSKAIALALWKQQLDGWRNDRSTAKLISDYVAHYSAVEESDQGRVGRPSAGWEGAK